MCVDNIAMLMQHRCLDTHLINLQKHDNHDNVVNAAAICTNQRLG